VRDVSFRDIRQDWYYANQLVPRLFRNWMRRSEQVRFSGFPRQWIPVFEYYGVPWHNCCEPSRYMPLISEVSDEQLARFCSAAKQEGTLRTFLESIAVLDPVLADFVYIVDQSMTPSLQLPSGPILRDNQKLIALTSWQSYGRPEVRCFEGAVDQVCKLKSIAVVLPCSRRRPYRNSRTHQRIWRALNQIGYKQVDVDQIVVTSLGVVPEALWEHPVVMGYDAGVPDIYRVLRLARRFFKRNGYEQIIDCLQFAPYSDILKILLLEKIVTNVSSGPVPRSRQFYMKA
jgi:predicted RNA-binding protein